MLLAVAFAAAVLAQTPPQGSQAGQVAQTKQQGRSVQKADQHSKDSNPDMDLIGYLGEFEDAADGLDPMGLTERPDLAQQKDGKDGHRP
jgi:hypothetical protein